MRLHPAGAHPLGDHLADPVVDGVHQLDPIGQPRLGQPALGDAQGLRVAVDADDPQPGVRGQQGEGVAAHAEGGVDEHDIPGSGSGGRLDGGGQQFVHPAHQHRHVAVPGVGAGSAPVLGTVAVRRAAPHRRPFLPGCAAATAGRSVGDCWADSRSVGWWSPDWRSVPDSWSPPASVLARGKSCQGRGSWHGGSRVRADAGAGRASGATCGAALLASGRLQVSVQQPPLRGRVGGLLPSLVGRPLGRRPRSPSAGRRR